MTSTGVSRGISFERKTRRMPCILTARTTAELSADKSARARLLGNETRVTWNVHKRGTQLGPDWLLERERERGMSGM